MTAVKGQSVRQGTPAIRDVRKKTNLCIPVCLYSISGHYIDFFDLQTNRSLQHMKIELRLHRESCSHVHVEVLLMELLACHMYLSVKE